MQSVDLQILTEKTHWASLLNFYYMEMWNKKQREARRRLSKRSKELLSLVLTEKLPREEVFRFGCGVWKSRE